MADGTLTIKNRAAARIAEIAALEVPGVVRRSSRFAGIAGRVLPRAIVDMTPVEPNIRVDIAVNWPAPVASVCRDVRNSIASRIGELTDRHPARIDVSVTELVPTDDD